MGEYSLAEMLDVWQHLLGTLGRLSSHAQHSYSSHGDHRALLWRNSQSLNVVGQLISSSLGSIYYFLWNLLLFSLIHLVVLYLVFILSPNLITGKGNERW